MMTPMGDERDERPPRTVSSVDVRAVGPVTEVEVRGEIDIAASPAFDAAVQAAVDEGASVLVMHLGDVTFMGSSGLAGLLKAQRLMREAGGRLVLAEPSAAVTDLLDMTKLRERFGLDDGGGSAAGDEAAPPLRAGG